MSITASVCVFCGSRSGHDPAIAEEALRLGELIAANGWRLVYGAGDVGIMGVVASAAQAAGGQTLGVIPVHLMKLERTRGDRAGLVVTETMHERKKVMFMNSDAIVVLPGGAGTLDEFFEILTWRQLHLHGKPIFLLDTGGFWSPLIALLDHVIAQGFADPSLKDYVGVAPSAVALEAELRAALP